MTSNSKIINRDITEFHDKFLRIERDLDLINYNIRGKNLWLYNRSHLYYELLVKNKLLLTGHNYRSKSKLIKVKRVIHFIKAILIYNPLFFLKKYNIVIIDHMRYKKVSGKKIDIYSEYLRNNLIEQGEKVVLLENSLNGIYKDSAGPKKYLGLINMIEKIAIWLMSIISEFDKEELERIKKIEQKIYETYNISYSIHRMFHRTFIKFIIRYKLMKYILRISGTKTVYIVDPYSRNMDYVKAANDLDLDTIEIQHGIISKLHPGYSFLPEQKNNEYITDQICIWGEYWISQLVLEYDKIRILGFNYLKKRLDEFRDIKKSEKHITIISQGSIGNELSNIVYSRRQLFENYNVKYKLHPGEYNNQYIGLNQLEKLYNFEIVKDEIDLYELLAQSNIIIGVYSTAILEGVGLGCKVILVDLPGVEYLEGLIEEYRIPLLHEIVELESIENQNISSEQFFG